MNPNIIRFIFGFNQIIYENQRLMLRQAQHEGLRREKLEFSPDGIRIQKAEFRIEDTEWNAVKLHEDCSVLSLSAQIGELIFHFDELI